MKLWTTIVTERRRAVVNVWMPDDADEATVKEEAKRYATGLHSTDALYFDLEPDDLEVIDVWLDEDDPNLTADDMAFNLVPCPSCGKPRPDAVSKATFRPGSVCPHCGHIEPNDER